MIPAGALAIFTGVLALWVALAPWFVTVSGTVGGTSTGDIDLSFLFVKTDGGSYTTHWESCSGTSTCDEFRQTQLGLQVGYGVAGLLFIAGGACAFAKSAAGLFLLAIAASLQGGALFGFFFRGLPLYQKGFYETSATADMTWTYSYSSYVAAGAVLFSLVSLVVFALLLRTARHEAIIAAAEPRAADEGAENLPPTAAEPKGAD
uniref:Uncharacterized protein n=1 Tax=Neobodo designis TaxID=312471 RepID=A0A7S1Q6U6_NEODS|mmetsp:Transcript_32989/g.101894  ORF Transcript_32989/g.101894 Transcript_32989/m.101894 type:complete len:205 (+) Transcript_32989:86-700(+)